MLQSGARIDLLVTDVGLPGGMNGRQMADAARACRPDLKVLFITGYAECAVVGDGLLGQGMQVLTKPFRMDALGARIRDLVADPKAAGASAGHENRVDPDGWRPLIMSFQNFYGLGPGRLHPSRLATIPEDRYRP